MILTPVEVELLRNAITSIADEMYIALMKSAYSTNIKERRDHSTAIFDANGRVVAQGESMPLHLASMLGLVEVVLEKYDPGSLQPGDMFLSNDPFVGRGSHLPDVSMAAPVFSDGKLVMFVANIAHHADIGGMVPGSMAGGMTEIYQEGLRIPPIRLIAGGQLQEDLMDLILLNVRVPEERRGDYNAQIAANKLGVKRCQSIVEKWSVARLTAGMGAMIQAVAQRMRAAISDIPDNKYQFTDVIDDDGIDATQIKLVVEITVQGDEIIFDFEGTSPQVKGNINVTMAGLQAACLYSLKVLIDPECPQNHGMLDPISIKAPLGTIVNAEFPAASAARAQTGQRIVDLIFGALADALPERIIAAGNGANTSASFFGRMNDGRFYVYLETLGGGAGGRAYQDGTDGIQVHMTNTSNLPIESLETEYPLMIERYELVPDSGGAGKWRGGLGLRRIYRPVGHTVTFSGQGERFVNSPWGLFGAHSGATGSFDLAGDDGTRQHLSNKPSAVEVNPDTVIIVTTPGAGGYGLPVERNHEALHDDARSEKFSARFLKQKYNYLE
ncbi:MAG: hydantoinase B/oxoprolinase family protein [Gammaproteobacteria bacterium]|jgi:N-methylhydantoinase B|nr:hydantoinase B/oxoprolinase family protein [Gammaproteobacteria bacterium]|tara:strand:- start:2514 stop:4181 length:1668 start_codon:yes stop_codon:yes gene_type:complete